MEQQAPQPVTLEALWMAAEVTHYDRVFWFGVGKPEKEQAVIRQGSMGPVLLVPDQTCLRFIQRCWFPAMQRAYPALTIAARTPEPAKATEKPKRSIWNKKGREYHAKRLGGMD